MRKVALLFYVLLISHLSFSQEVINDANAEMRTVESFHGVRVASGIDLYLVQGNEQSVAVSAANTRYRDKITTKVKDGVLEIKYDEADITISFRNRKLKAYVSVTSINELKASGGSDVYIKSGLQAENLQLSLSGGSDFTGAIEAGQLVIRISGGSDVKIKGKVEDLEIRASGGSDFSGYDLIAEKAYIRASGGSDAGLTVNRELSVEASGGSDVYYKGKGVITSMNTGRSSSVSKRG